MATQTLIDVPFTDFGLGSSQAFLKRTFDILVSAMMLGGLWWLIALVALAARIDTGLSGFYAQRRVGLFGKSFTLYKIRSMREIAGLETTVTRDGDPRVTSLGKFFRRTKLDELPQLWNVLVGDMSFVGPRPDVVSTYRELSGRDLKILTIRPGITGPASIEFRGEEALLGSVMDAEAYNRDVVFPRKVELNLDYIENYSFVRDIKLVLKTAFPFAIAHEPGPRRSQ